MAAIPNNVQCMAIKGARVVLSISGGQRAEHVRGVVFGNGKVHVLYESGAKQYAGADYGVNRSTTGRRRTCSDVQPTPPEAIVSRPAVRVGRRADRR